MKNPGKMSLWGIGPVLGLLCFLLTLPAAYFSIQFSDIFIISRLSFVFCFFGLLSVVFGLWLWIGAGSRIDKYIRKGVLADRGFYGIVRNPVYSGIIFSAGGVFLCTRSILLIGLPVVFYLLLRLLVVKEERILEAEFGKQYTEYRKRVNSVIPKPGSFVSAFFYPEPTKRIFEDLYAVKSRDVNIFIVSSGKTLVCIDAGYRDKGIPEEFEKLKLDTDRVSAVFLTHSDMDHAGGLGFFKNASICLGKGEEALINGKRCRFGKIYKNKRIDKPYSLLEENDVLEFEGITVKAVGTPGHTIGHTAYLVNRKYLFTGDAVLLQNGLIRPFYRILSMNRGETLRSAEKIRNFEPAEWLFTSHSGYVNRQRSE